MATPQYNNFANIITFTRASSGTYMGSDGLIKTASSNVPRVDYDPVGNVMGLLIEESRTNILLFSEQFSNAAWGKFGTAVTTDTVLSPTGLANASKVTITSLGSFRGVSQTISATAGDVVSYTIYVSAGNHSYATVKLQAKAGATLLGTPALVRVNLTNGTQIGSPSGTVSVTPLVNNWYEISVTGTLTTGSDSATYAVDFVDSTGSPSPTPSIPVGSFIYLWGAQAEIGPFPTSYIQTTSAAATRAEDVASIPTSAFGYNAAAGTVVCQFDMQYAATVFPRVWEIGSSSTDINRIANLVSGPSSTVTAEVRSNNVGVASFTLYADATPASGVTALAFAENDFAAVANNGTVQTDTSGTMTPSVARDLFRFGNSTVGFSGMSGHLKYIKYYPYRLLNTQIQGLTA